MAENELDLHEEESDVEGEEGEIDWKARALTAEGKAKRYFSSHRELQAFKRVQAEEKPAPEKEASKEKLEFGLDEVNFLHWKNIDEEFFPRILKEVNDTGKRLQDVVKFKYLLDEYKDWQDQKAVENALPKDTKHGGGTISRDTVDYWLAKGELPPKDQKELRRKVVEAKIKREEGKAMFTDNPIV